MPWTVPPENTPYNGWIPHVNVGVPGGIPTRVGAIINVKNTPYFAAGVTTETTGTISNGSTSLTVADASSFQVEQGIRVGTKQVVNLTVTSGATATGNLKVNYATNTDDNFNKGVLIAVTSGDTAEQVAAKIRASTLFDFEWDVSGSGAVVTLTRKITVAITDSFYFSNQGGGNPDVNVSGTSAVITVGSVVVNSYITNIAGNVLTIFAAASGDVTNGVVSHNDGWAIYNAIQAASDGDTIYLPAGDYRVDGSINIGNKSLTVKGDGTSTRIHFLLATGTGIYIGRAAIEDYTVHHTVISGITAGSSTVTIESASTFSNNRLAKIEYENDITIPVLTVAGYPYRQGQMVKVVSTTSNTVTFEPEIAFSYPGITRISTGGGIYIAAEIGLEDLQVFAYNQIQYIVFMENTRSPWIKNVKFNNAKNVHILLESCLYAEIRDSHFTTVGNGQSPNGGIIWLNNSSNALIENNIFEGAFPLVEINNSMWNAILFNFCYNSQSVAFDDNHNPHPRFNLYEGNKAENIVSDGYYGGSSHATVFRNRFTNRSTTASTFGYSYILKRGARSYVFVGNVNGTASTDVIYDFGGPNMGNGSSYGFANFASGVPWAHMNLSGNTPFEGIYLRSGDNSGSVSLTGAGTVDLLGFPYIDRNEANMVIYWGSGTLSQRAENVRAISTGQGTVYFTKANGNIALSGGDNVRFWVGALGFQERDSGVAPTCRLLWNWNTVDSGIPVSEQPSGGLTFPNSLAYPSGKPSWWGDFGWPAYDPDYPQYKDDVRIPANYRYLNSGDTPSNSSDRFIARSRFVTQRILLASRRR